MKSHVPKEWGGGGGITKPNFQTEGLLEGGGGGNREGS